MSFTIIPAIDLREGKVVRLYQGDYDRQTDYAVDPLELAHAYRAAGAQWLHVVDLDGAREGAPRHAPLIARLAQTGLRVQAGGGVRSAADIEALHAAGVERVVLGSIAVRDPDRVRGWLADYGGHRLTLALDTRWREGAWRLPSAGWTEDEAATLDDLAPRYAAMGARHLLCTDIDCDGTLQGPNLSLYHHLRHIAPALDVQVSGGVRSVGDVVAARETGAAGIVLGRALLEKRFTVAEAIDAVA